jgi:hypothetical protein
VEAARRQLEQTVKAVKEIAASCGFSSSEIMRRTFLSQLQVTPSAYRLRFQRRSPFGKGLSSREAFSREPPSGEAPWERPVSQAKTQARKVPAINDLAKPYK